MKWVNLVGTIISFLKGFLHVQLHFSIVQTNIQASQRGTKLLAVVKPFPLAAVLAVSQCHITKTRLFKYIENLTSKNSKFSDKKNLVFLIFLLKTKIVGTR